ncbi:MotE family protein [Actibacterium ureilyticum]|uniref:MotE family protein n=1 Tax=Actibacterium ureilyticum TaxID=1590614 RepID=UPI000BAB18D1|nr:hypothetical protein [Actibacterium ureilyticum]
MSRARSTRRGALFAISAMLVLSALIRAGYGIAPAVAREVGVLRETTAEHMADPAPEADTLIAALQTRGAALDAMERDLVDRKRNLDLAEQQIALRLQELKAAEDSLRETLALAKVAAESDLSRLTAVYESMKPKEAAQLFEAMDPDFAAGFLGRMRPDAAAQIMAGLSPDSAYRISVVLAGRNANAPTE